MNTRNYIQPLLILLEGILLLGVLAGCGSRKQTHTDNATTLRDLPQLKDSGRLVALTLYSSTSYFIYRGQEMGFQYELVQQFAESLGLTLEVKVARNVRDLERKLLAGEGDLIAYTLPITKEGRDSVTYCGNEVITHQVIVQRKNGQPKPLKDVTELIGKEIYVKPGKLRQRTGRRPTYPKGNGRQYRCGGPHRTSGARRNRLYGSRQRRGTAQRHLLPQPRHPTCHQL